MTSHFADNVLCAVFANESGRQLSWVCFGDCNFRSVTLVTLCTFKGREKKKDIYDNHFHLKIIFTSSR